MTAFIDLQAQQAGIRDKIDLAITKVLDHGQYIMGPEVAQLETDLSVFCGAKHSLSCSNGTDALSLALMALNVGAGDAVIVPSFTFVATAEVVSLLGATPIFADIDINSFNISTESIVEAYTLAKQHDLTPKGIIAVDLFGRPADYSAIEKYCTEQGLWLISDAAQSFGATYQNRNVGTIGTITTTSFFPAKPLGCYGDGGAIFTDNDDIAQTLTSMRIHGKGSNKYDNIRIGTNARMDTLQAAILIEKLKIFSDEIKARNILAQKYHNAFKDIVQIPDIPDEITSTWAQYTLRIDGGRRDNLASTLKGQDIPTVVYYPIPLHLQKAYQHYPQVNCSASELATQQVLSLPMHPYMDEQTSDMIIDAVKKALA